MANNVNNVITGVIDIPGALRSRGAADGNLVGGVVAYAGDIYDSLFTDGTNTGMNQAAINDYLKTHSGTTYTHPTSHPASMITYDASTEYLSGNVGYAIKALQLAIADVPTYSAGTAISINNGAISVNASLIDYDNLKNILVRNVDYKGVSIDNGGFILDGENNVVMGYGSCVIDGWGTIAAGYHAIAKGWGACANGAFAYATGKGAHVEGYGAFENQAIVRNGYTSGSTSLIVDRMYPVGAVVLNEDANNVQCHVTNCQTWSNNSSYYELTLSHSLDADLQSGTSITIIGCASGTGAHAEGVGTIAKGSGAHAEGMYTVTNNGAEHACGKYNNSTPEVRLPGNANVSSYGTQFSIGVGSSYTQRVNAFEVLGNGDIYVKGLGSYDGTSISNVSTLLNVITGVNTRLSDLEGAEITAEDVSYDSSETYSNGTVGLAIQNGITASAASAAAAASSASTASEYYSDILTAMGNLGNGEAVTAQVAVNQAGITALAKKASSLEELSNGLQDTLDEFMGKNGSVPFGTSASLITINSSAGLNASNVLQALGELAKKIFPLDRYYDEENPNGLGYIVLDGSKSFESQVTDIYTQYEVRNDFVLSSNVTMPIGCILRFEGGHISGAKITLTDTKIICGFEYGIIMSDVDGSTKTETVYPEWFMESANDDATNAIKKALKISSKNGSTILFAAEEYLVKGGQISLVNNTIIKSTNQSKIRPYNTNSGGYTSIIKASNKKNILIENICFDQTTSFPSGSDKIADIDNTTTPVGKTLCSVYLENCNNATIRNCTFKSVGRNTVKAASVCDFIYLYSNRVDFRYRAVKTTYDDVEDGYAYDNSAFFINAAHHIIKDNFFWGYDRIGAAIESHGRVGDITSNTAYNVRNFVHVVNDNYNYRAEGAHEHEYTDTIYDDKYDYGKTIIGNRMLYCNNFLTIWRPKIEHIKNIIVANNVGICKESIIRTGLDLGDTDDYAVENLIVRDNYFESVPYTLINYADGEEGRNGNFYRGINATGAFRLTAQQDWKNVIIENNTFANFKELLVLGRFYRTSYNDDDQTAVLAPHEYDVTFRHNTCLNCLSGDYNDNVKTDTDFYFFGLISLRGTGRLIFTDNVIDISPDIVFPPTLIADNTVNPNAENHSVDFTFERNTFPRLKTVNVTCNPSDKTTPVVSVETDFFRLSKSLYIDDDKPSTLLAGDAILKSTGGYKLINSSGTDKSDTLPDSTISRWYGKYWVTSASIASACDIGDFIKLTSSTHNLTTRVTAIVGDNVYFDKLPTGTDESSVFSFKFVNYTEQE